MYKSIVGLNPSFEFLNMGYIRNSKAVLEYAICHSVTIYQDIIFVLDSFWGIYTSSY